MPNSLVVGAYDLGARQPFLLRWLERGAIIGLGTFGVMRCRNFPFAKTIKLSRFSWYDSAICTAAVTFTAERLFTGAIAYHLWHPASGQDAPTPSKAGLVLTALLVAATAGTAKLLGRNPFVWGCGALLPIIMLQRYLAAQSIAPPSKRISDEFAEEGYALQHVISDARFFCWELRTEGLSTQELQQGIDRAEELLRNPESAQQLIEVAEMIQSIRSLGTPILWHQRLCNQAGRIGRKMQACLAIEPETPFRNSESAQYAARLQEQMQHIPPHASQTTVQLYRPLHHNLERLESDVDEWYELHKWMASLLRS